MSKKKLSKLLALYLPYVVIGLLATNLGEAWRLAVGKELGDKIVSLMDTLPAAFSNPLPSLHPIDLFIGLCCGAGMRLAVYLKGKNAKKYRHGMEYGSARWGGPKDIEPFMAPIFENNIILTKTERLMMSNRPPDPKNARNKNVLVVGGSGSGKTRFWLKPNLLQCHSSYVITDPKGSIVIECGNALLQKGYKLKIFNTINFSKSMRYNPMAYIHSEKDILKLVTALMTNTKGEGQGGDPFWDKAERLLLVSLIAYLHYEAPVEEQNFATLLEMLNTMQVSEDDETFQNPVDLLFEDLGKKKPKSFAVRQYKLYKLAAGVVCHQLDLEHRGVHGAAMLYAVQDWFRRPEHSGRTLRRWNFGSLYFRAARFQQGEVQSGFQSDRPAAYLFWCSGSRRGAAVLCSAGYRRQFRCYPRHDGSHAAHVLSGDVPEKRSARREDPAVLPSGTICSPEGTSVQD